MFYDTIAFPATSAYGAQGGPRFATTVAPSPSGAEALMAHWPRELGAWDLVQRNRTAAETVALIALFRVACGRAHGFCFPDSDDETATDQLLGTGDGATVAFQLLKHYDEGALTYQRVITKPVSGSVTCTLNGTPTVLFTVNLHTGVVTFASAPGVGVLVRASYTFWVPVRFDMDAMDVSCDAPEAYTWAGIRLVEIPYAEAVA